VEQELIMEIHLLAEKVSSIFVSMLLSTILVNWFKSLETESNLFGEESFGDIDHRQSRCPTGRFIYSFVNCRTGGYRGPN